MQKQSAWSMILKHWDKFLSIGILLMAIGAVKVEYTGFKSDLEEYKKLKIGEQLTEIRGDIKLLHQEFTSELKAVNQKIDGLKPDKERNK